MRKAHIRIISALCLVSMLFVMLVGCGGAGKNEPAVSSDSSTTAQSGSTSTAAASTTEEKLPEVTITLEMTALPATVKENQDDNPIVKAIEDKLNVKLRFKATDSSANTGVEMMRLHLQTGQAGDIVSIPTWGAGATQLMEDAVVEGLFANIGDIAAKNPGRYPTMEKCFSDKDFQYYNAQYYKQPKAHYSFWAAGYTTNPTGAPVYNMKIINELGASMPKTLDEFVAYLRLVKSKKPGVIPFIFRNDKGVKLGDRSCEINQIFFQTQGTDYNHMIKDSNGNWSDTSIDPKNKEIWKQLAAYYKEGLIDKELFTYKDDAYMDKFYTGKIAVVTCAMPNQNPNSFLSYLDSAQKANPDIKKEDMLNFMQEQAEPLTGPGGSGSNKDTTFSIHYGNFISSTSKNPDRALDVLNFLASDEGMTLQWYGIKGVHYQDQDADGNITGFNIEKFKADNMVWGFGGTIGFWVGMFSGSGQIYFIDRNNGWGPALKKQSSNKANADFPQPILDYAQNTWQVWSDKGFIADPPYYSALKNIASAEDVYAKLKEIKTKYFSGFIFGNLPVDANWDKFVKELKDAGLDGYVKTVTDLEKSSKFKYDSIAGAQ